MKKYDENWQVEKFVKVDKMDKNNKKLLKENKMSSDEAERDFATNDVNEKLFV